MESYLGPFLQALLASIGFILAFQELGRRWLKGGRRATGGRHIHQPEVSRWGGAAIILSFWGVLAFHSELVFTPPLWGLAGGSAAILFFGLWDDLRELSWKIQLAFQLILAGAAYFWGVRTEHVAGGMISLEYFGLSFIFTVSWLLLSMNSLNWLDGVDGVSGGVAFLGATALFFLALKPEVNQPPVAIISAALAGATLGFLFFNFPPGKIMAGTSGALFFGFMLGALALFAGAKVATALLVMAVPIVDLIWVIGERWLSRASIFESDQRHWHHNLLRLGWSPLQIALFFFCLTLLLTTLALNTRFVGKLVSIAVAFLWIIFLMALTRFRAAAIR